MNTEKALSPQESMDVIEKALARTRENVRENGFYFLLWGWLVAISSFSFFLLQNFTSFRFFFIGFPILGSTGVIVTILHYNKRKASATETHLSYFLSRMWAVLAICFVVSVFVSVSRGMVPFTYTLIVAGAGTLISGWVMKFQPLVIGGILFLIASVTSIYIPEEYKSLLHGVVIVAGYLVPGYLLKNSNA